MSLPFHVSFQTFVSVQVILIALHVMLGAMAYSVWLERKLSGWIQDRIGPNRVGPFGLLQPLADGVKLFTKEDYAPKSADKALFTIAPLFVIATALIAWGIVPLGGYMDLNAPLRAIPGLLVVEPGRAAVAAVDINVGIVFLLAVASLGVYGVVLGGWASNNKYSFLGGLRATASMVSYEVPMGLSLLCVLLIAGSVHAHSIVEHQAAQGWFIVSQPLAALLFFICLLAENNRAPFDNAEAESELVGGYHTEYTSMRMGVMLLGEYGHVCAAGAIFAMLFLGGYHLPGVAWFSPETVGAGLTGLLYALLKFGVVFAKAFLVVFLVMLARWTLPRMRWDQIMRLCWNGLIPAGVALLVATSFFVWAGWTAWWQLLALNVALTATIVGLQVLLPQRALNRKVQLSGSRFSPPPGEEFVAYTPPRRATAAAQQRPAPPVPPASLAGAP